MLWFIFMKQSENIAKLKAEYIKYFEQVPVQKYAAMHIARNEDTILRWKANDADFADAVQRAKAAYVLKLMPKVKPEFALERLMKDVFADRTELVIEQRMPVHGTGTTTQLRERMIQMVKEEIRAPKKST